MDRLVKAVLERQAVRMVFQPAVRLADGVVAAVEALARFDHHLLANPAEAFALAERFGYGVELEHLAVRRALDRLDEVPGELMMCVNLSAAAVLDPGVQATLLSRTDRRIGVELTEHTQVADYAELTEATERLRAAGIRIVVDDAGSGYAGLTHLLHLRPTIIKLDMGLIQGVDEDPARQALARSLVGFAADIEANLVAEGIETAAQHDTLRRLGVGYGQGYYLGRPAAEPWLETDKAA